MEGIMKSTSRMSLRCSSDNNIRRLAICLAAMCMALWASTSPAAAQSREDTRTPAVGVSTQQPLLLQARRIAGQLNQTTPGDASSQDNAAKTPTRKAYLTLGLIGVGTAVAGLFVYRGANDHPNLPGIANGRETTGWVMVAVGGGIGTLSLIKAFN
jgi:hypothetical protein